MPSRRDVTRLLDKVAAGEQDALRELIPLVYSELRRLAAAYLRREREGHTLQPTALVHEAYLRLVDQEQARWQNRGHFFGVAAQLMRHILVDYGRAHHAVKRGGAVAAVPLDDAIAAAVAPLDDVVAIDAALTRLTALDPRQARIVELRVFGGLTIDETAAAMNISPTLVKREWKIAKAWLHRELSTRRVDS